MDVQVTVPQKNDEYNDCYQVKLQTIIYIKQFALEIEQNDKNKKQTINDATRNTT